MEFTQIEPFTWEGGARGEAVALQLQRREEGREASSLVPDSPVVRPI